MFSEVQSTFLLKLLAWFLRERSFLKTQALLLPETGLFFSWRLSTGSVFMQFCNFVKVFSFVNFIGIFFGQNNHIRLSWCSNFISPTLPGKFSPSKCFTTFSYFQQGILHRDLPFCSSHGTIESRKYPQKTVNMNFSLMQFDISLQLTPRFLPSRFNRHIIFFKGKFLF